MIRVKISPEITVAEATHANLVMHTETQPNEITRIVSEKQLVIRRMDAVLDPNWKPEMVAGGFCAHCVNQHTQVWTYIVNKSYPEIRIRLHSDGRWRDKHGSRYSLSTAPRKFRDYNF